MIVNEFELIKNDFNAAEALPFVISAKLFRLEREVGLKVVIVSDLAKDVNIPDIAFTIHDGNYTDGVIKKVVKNEYLKLRDYLEPRCEATHSL